MDDRPGRPGFTVNDDGKNEQYGPLIDTPFNAGGHDVGHGLFDVRQIIGIGC